ncbi:MAG: hypothetical protein WC508_02745 [Patescibacteria group bacterium]
MWTDAPFRLKLDASQPKNTPHGMINEFALSAEQAQNFQYKGKSITGRGTQMFRLVCVGKQPNLDAVLREIEEKYHVGREHHHGQWLQPYVGKFRKNYPAWIGVPDPSWRGPNGQPCFPCVLPGGAKAFLVADKEFGREFFWLIPVLE